MTNQITLQKLAEQTGLSKSTISRAINYCGGVDAETALAIRRMAIEQGYTTPADGRGAPFCGVVLPEKPGYYWYPAQKNLYDTLRAGGISFRAALYPRLTDEEAFVSALEAMAALSPRVLVVSAPSHSAAGQRLRSVAARIPVFLLSELIQGANLFYFGSDAQRDGAALAGAFVAAYPDRHRLLVVDTEQNKARTAAFLSACPSLHVVERIALPEYHPSSAALLARRIASDVSEHFDCVYCGTGALPSVCLALDKLRVDSSVICIGYENPPGNAQFIHSGRIGLALCQDIAAQSELCAKAVIELKEKRCFPNRKYNYVDFRVVYA